LRVTTRRWAIRRSATFQRGVEDSYFTNAKPTVARKPSPASSAR
jgi:hypothetical protein